MAIKPNELYPGQVAAHPNHPYGKAQNAATEEDDTGTPLEANWVNDLWGFQQALLVRAGIAPSGVPDEAGASQYVDAIRAIHRADLLAPGTQIQVGAPGIKVTGITELGQVKIDSPVSPSIDVMHDGRVRGTLYAWNAELGGGSPNPSLILRGPLKCANTGRLVGRSEALDDPRTFSPAAANWFFVANAIPGIRNYTIDDTGCLDDDEFGVTNPSGNTAYIYPASGSYIAAIPSSAWATFRRSAGAWVKTMAGSL